MQPLCPAHPPSSFLMFKRQITPQWPHDAYSTVNVQFLENAEPHATLNVQQNIQKVMKTPGKCQKAIFAISDELDYLLNLDLVLGSDQLPILEFFVRKYLLEKAIGSVAAPHATIVAESGLQSS